MGRSVATPSNSVTDAFFLLGDDIVDNHEFEDVIQNLTERVCRRFPSMRPTRGWLERESRIIAENEHGQVTVSEYCGIVAVSLVPQDFYDAHLRNIGVSWCCQISDAFRTLINENFHGLRPVARASNGEMAYKRVR